MTIQTLEINSIDRTENVGDPGSRTSNVNDVFGKLAQIRNFKLNSNTLYNFESVSPFTPSGILSHIDIRNKTVQVTGEDDQISFLGNIKRYGATRNKTWETNIQSAEAMTILLKFIVEENDKTTHNGFLTNGAIAIGDQIDIAIDTGLTDIPDGALISFSTDLVPKYQIQSSTGSPTTLITLDRPSEIAVLTNTAIVVSVPSTTKTIAEALEDAFTTVGLTNLGSSFGKYKSDESSYLVHMNVTTEDRITLADHISQLLKMGNFNLIVNSAGQIDIRRGWQWSGSTVSDYISEYEIMPPVSISTDDSNLVIGADTLYVNGTTVEVSEQEAESFYINAYAGKRRFQPIKTASGSSLIKDYSYLYGDSAGADFYGLSFLNENKSLRHVVSCNVKGNYAADIGSVNVQNGVKPLNIEVGKDFDLTMDFASGQEDGSGFTYWDEPVAVRSYTFNENTNIYSGVNLILTNYPYPNVIRNAEPANLLILNAWGINEGLVLTMATIGTKVLFLEIYDATGDNLITKQAFSRSAGTISDEAGSSSYDYVQLTDSNITNGINAHYQAYTITGNNRSETDLTLFVPQTRDNTVNNRGVGIFTMP